MDDYVSIILHIYIQFMSVPDTLLPCSSLFTLMGVVLSALPFSQFPHRFKKN